MSTLTSSPSPAASPCTHFYVAPHRTTQRSPALASPRSRPNAPSAATAPSSRASITHQSPRTTFITPPVKSQTADAGTQYTPEGLPPTARAALDESCMTNKRKGTSTSPSMPAAAETPAHAPPLEPQPRNTPAPHDKDSSVAIPNGPGGREGEIESPSKKPRTAPPNVKVMPLKYEDCNVKELGVLIANMLMELIRLNDPIPLRDGRLTRFHSRAPPGISCHDYLLRLIQHATLSPPILLSMVYYIDRLCALYPAFTISSLTVHRFLITAATVAAKGLSDSFWTNPTYARIGGISTSELATLELEFLQKVQWRIVPKPEVLVDYYVSLVSRSEGYELEKREGDDKDGDRKMKDEPP